MQNWTMRCPRCNAIMKKQSLTEVFICNCQWIWHGEQIRFNGILNVDSGIIKLDEKCLNMMRTLDGLHLELEIIGGYK